ncbi:MAG: hypothetical protein ACRCXM_17655 [Beijerinckiaceae bacterium]
MAKEAMTGMRILLTGLMTGAWASMALTAPLSDPTTADLEKLRPAAGNVLIVEYYDAERRKIAAQTYPSPERGKPSGGVRFQLPRGPTIDLWGLSPCPHERPLVDGEFSGSCRKFAEFGMAAILRSGPVVLCRAFADQQDKPSKSASCFILTSYATLHGVTKIEEFLVSGGYALLARDANGKALRPDLEDDERIAKGFGRGLWALEHERVRREQRQ